MAPPPAIMHTSFTKCASVLDITVNSALLTVLMELLVGEISFASQLVAYFVIIGFIVAMFYCLLKQAEYSDRDHETIRDRDARESRGSETQPVLPNKEVIVSYGGTKEQPESSICSAEDLCREKMCKICYDQARSCFFVPCGHGFTCFTCARRIVEDENKTCPICRRLIHRIKRLEFPLDDQP